MTPLNDHVTTLGPAAVLLGAAFEGQTFVIAGGVMVRNHLISLPFAVGLAALGSILVDHLLFILGRSFRDGRFVRKASEKPAFDKALRLIERHPTAFILSFRFLYGLRAAGPVAVGVSQVSHPRFAWLNVLGAVIWASVFVAMGYAFGPVITTLLHSAVQHVAPIAAGLGGVVLCALVLWRWRIWATRTRPVS